LSSSKFSNYRKTDNLVSCFQKQLRLYFRTSDLTVSQPERMARVEMVKASVFDLKYLERSLTVANSHPSDYKVSALSLKYLFNNQSRDVMALLRLILPPVVSFKAVAQPSS
jgi:hypothetical protein